MNNFSFKNVLKFVFLLNKNSILILNTAQKIFKSFICPTILTFFAINSVSGQTETVKKDSLSLENEIVNDSLPQDSVRKKATPLVSKDAIDAKIEYHCEDSMMFSMAEGKMFMYGTSVITTEDKKIEAELINIDTDENTFFAEGRIDSTGNEVGRPHFQDGDEKFIAKNMRYNFKTEKGIVREVKSEYDEGYIHGELTKRHPNKEIHIADGKYTTCDLDHPHFYIRLTKAKVIPEDKTVSGPMYFVIADIPLYLIGLPFGYIPRPKNDASGFLMPEYGEDSRRGFFLRNGGYYWGINEYINTAVRGDIYSMGGWAIKSSTTFKRRYKYTGNLNMTYNMNKQGEPETPEYRKFASFSIRGTYSQDSKANPYQNFSGNINYSYSKDYQFEATNINDYANNSKNSSLSYRRSRPGGRFNFTANMNASQNTSARITNLSLPVIALSMNRLQPAKDVSGKNLRWLRNFNVGFSSNFKNTVSISDTLLFTREAIENMRNGIQYRIPVSTSFNLFNYLNVSPSFNYTGRVYNEYVKKRLVIPTGGELADSLVTDTLPGLRAPFDFSFSLPVSTKLFGIYKGKGKRQSTLRHVVSPSISYNYRPDFSEARWGYYSYYQDDRDPSSLYSYYDIGVYGKPPSGESGAVGFSLGNNLELKTKTKKDTTEESFTKIKIIDNFSVSSSYNLAADSMNWAMISMRGNTRLFNSMFSLNYSSSFDPYVRDTLGARVNKFEWHENKRIARMSNTRFSINGKIDSNTFSGEKEDDKKSDEETKPARPDPLAAHMFPNPEIDYADFELPWSFNFGYTFNIVNQFDTEIQEYKIVPTQTLNFSGNMKLTKNWRISGRADYDFEAGKIAHTNLTVYRDLHCWEMSFTAIPFGQLKSYTFRINIKSAMFEGLEYKKEKSRYDY